MGFEANSEDTSRVLNSMPADMRERIVNALEYYRAAAEVMGRNRLKKNENGTHPQAGYSIAWFFGEVCTPERFDSLAPQVQAFLCSRVGGERHDATAEAGAPRIPVPTHALLENKPGISLNNSQLKAIELALNEPVSIVQGPPGTGKTETILNMVSCILALPGKPTVAVVANNGKAIDNISEKINEIKRRNPNDQPNRIKLATSYARLGNKAKRLEWNEEHGVQFQFENESQESRIDACKFLAEFPFITCTIHSLTKCFKNGRDYRYDYVIMDEASQCGVMLGLIPMNYAKHLVLVGDTKQLPPVYVQDLEPEIKRAAQGADEPEGHLSLTRTDAMGCEGNSILDAAAEAFPGDFSVMLDEHYRCHPGIIEFCNREFYDGKLKIMTPGYNPEAIKLPPIRVRWFSGNYSEPCSPKFKKDEIKRRAQGTYDADASAEEKGGKRVASVERLKNSKHNVRQIETFMADELPLLAERLLDSNPPSFCILSPFKGQIQQIKKLFDSIDLTSELSIKAIAAGDDPTSASALAGYALESGKRKNDDEDPRQLTIHKSQGHEYDIVYFLPVDDVNWEWPWSQGGRLVNVAVSRAKKELVIVASSSLLSEAGQRELVAAGLMKAECVVPPYRRPENAVLTEEGDGGNLRYVEELLEYLRLSGSSRFPVAQGSYGFTRSPMTSIFDTVPASRRLNNSNNATEPAPEDEREWMTERALYDALGGIDLAAHGLVLLRDVPIRDFISRNDLKAAIRGDEEVSWPEVEDYIFNNWDEYLAERPDFAELPIGSYEEGAHFDFAIVHEQSRKLVMAIEVDGQPHRCICRADVHKQSLSPEEAANRMLDRLCKRVSNDHLKDHVAHAMGARVLQGNKRCAWTDVKDNLLRASLKAEHPAFTMLRLPTDGCTAWETEQLKASARLITNRTSQYASLEELIDEQLAQGLHNAPAMQSEPMFKAYLNHAKDYAAKRAREKSEADTEAAMREELGLPPASPDVTTADPSLDDAPGISLLLRHFRDQGHELSGLTPVKANKILVAAGLIEKVEGEWGTTALGQELGIVCVLRTFNNGDHYQCLFPEWCHSAVLHILEQG